MKTFGRSLSLCVSDILRGYVKKEDVEIIVSSTAFATEEMWQKGIKSYSESYWIDFSENKISEVISYLRKNGKIEQPCLVNGAMHSCCITIWTDSYEECVKTLTVNF
jgi:hypothetical protein